MAFIAPRWRSCAGLSRSTTATRSAWWRRQRWKASRVSSRSRATSRLETRKLEGYRGRDPLDARALEDLLLGVAALVEDIPHVSEIDLNPVLVSEQGCLVLDARLKITTPAPPTPRGARTARRS